jgi:hypothetical protein
LADLALLCSGNFPCRNWSSLRLFLDRNNQLKVAFQLRSFAGDFAGGGVISPGFNGVAGLGIEGSCDGATGGGGGAGCLSLQPTNGIVKPKRVTADSNTIFFIVIHLLCNQTLGTPDLEFNTRLRGFVLTGSDDQRRPAGY